MKKKGLKRVFAALAACSVMASAMPVMNFAASAADNIIRNSTFETSTEEWGVYKESGGKYKLAGEDGKLALTVLDRGEVSYAVQLNQPTIKLYKNGVYRFSFDVSSTVDRYIEGMIQLDKPDYRSYVWMGCDVTTEMQTFEKEFVMEEETDIMAKLCFNCGVEEQDPADLPEHTLYFDNVTLELIDDSNVDYSETEGYQASIIANQVGYRPDAKKTAVFRNTEGGDFSIVNVDTEEVVFTGTMEGPKKNIQAEETNYTGDFSAVTAPGTYVIKSEGLDDSYPFVIGNDVYDDIFDETLRMLYLQRCGTAVEDKDFAHPSCHDTMATIYETDTKIDVNGGWHDAGDYGRYIVAAAKTVADLLYAYDASPELFSDNVGIPESGNGTPDVLDEVRYELEWMLKMQDKTDGGVYHKVTCATFPQYIMPEEETKPLIVMPKSTTATADFAASMALAYEFYKDVDSEFADTCLEAAKKAYEWAIANPNVRYTNPADVVTGEYGDKVTSDEIYWAKAQLYRATGDESYIADASVKRGLDWSTVGDYGNIAILTMDGIDKTSDIYTAASETVLKQAKDMKSVSDVMPYGVTLVEYNWGSNMTVANAGNILALAYKLTGEQEYLDKATAQLDYLLGTNPLGTSFVTGFGTVAPVAPHHRPSMAVGKCMPGMLVGGVNQNLEDPAAKAYCVDSADAKCWVDNAESYSTNEITIYWNSPLTYLFAMTEKAGEPVTPPTTEPPTTEPPVTDPTDVPSVPSIPATLLGDANCDGIVSIADATAILQHLGNNDEYALSEQGAANADVDGKTGVTAGDALSIQRLDAKLIDSLPDLGE